MAEDLKDLVEENTETLSSGVTVTVRPFPARLFINIQRKAEELFPDLPPPLKTIEVVDGTEEVEDREDPDYLVEQREVESQRAAWMSEKVLDVLLKFCVEVDLVEYEPIIAAMEETLWEFPANGLERQLEFVANYAARTTSDYNRLILRSLDQVTVDDEEVAARLKSFQDKLEGPGAGKPEASGAAEG